MEVAGDYQHMSGKPNYQDASDLASELMSKFLKGEIQKVDLLYNHFKSTSSQILTHETYLPVDVNGQVGNTDNSEEKEQSSDYIIEPSAETIMKSLVPKVLRMKIYTVLLDAAASEHAARTMAMQIATANADDLIQALTVVYNKSRKQAIKTELLAIVGGPGG